MAAMLELFGSRRKSKFWEITETFVGALAIALICRATLAEARWIPTPSMVPTLAIGDRLVVDKVTYHFRTPVRGDIVVFHPPKTIEDFGINSEFVLVKRVIGLPGERIEVREGHVFINDLPLQENYIADAPIYTMPEQVIPQGMVFVMGDNRNQSADSHIWGPLPIRNVIGRAQLRFWPPSRFNLL